MKQIRLLLTLFAVALLGSFSSNANAAETEATREATVSSFNEIHIVGGYDAQLIPGDKFSYKVTWDAVNINDIEIVVDENKFKASIKSIKNKFSKNHPILVVTYPANYAFGDFKVHLSAGAKLDIKDFNSDNIKIKALAGSDFLANALSAKNGEVDLDAGSELVIGKIVADYFDIKLTSGSDMSINNIEAKSIKIKGTSGADGTIAGKASNTEIDLSSAARINAKELISEVVDLEASSGANIRMGVVENQITAKATSGGSISYSGNPSTNNIKHNSGGSVNKL